MYLHMSDFLFGKDVDLSFQTRKTINTLQRGNFDKGQIQAFLDDLFFVKTTDFGQGCYSSFIPLALYRLMNSVQQYRTKKFKEKKLDFIQRELTDSGLLDDLDIDIDISSNNSDFDTFYKIANIHYSKRTAEEIITFIKEEMKATDLPLLPEEYYLRLQNNPNKLKKFYKQILNLKQNPSKKLVNIDIESKVKDIMKNIRKSKNNARYKAIYNFAEESEISWLTLTLAHHNKDGTISNEVKDLTKAKKLVIKFMLKLRYEYRKNLTQQGLKPHTITKYLKRFKYFIASQLQAKGAWHFHIMFNIDLLRIFGHTNKMVCQGKNTEFLESKEYYEINKQKYSHSFVKTNKKLIIPNVFKLWADIVRDNLPNLKKLNPKAQNLQLFYQGKKYAKKIEIQECKAKKTIIKKDVSEIIAQYISKYDAGLNEREIKKTIKLKQNHLCSKNLFQFSYNCQKLPITKTISYLPFDFHQSNYQMTSFYLSNIASWKQTHLFYDLLRSDILRLNKQKPVMKSKTDFTPNKNTTPEAYNFEKNKDKYIQTYHKKRGKLSTFYGIVFYAKKLFNNFANINLYKKLNQWFNLTKLKTKIVDNNLERQINFTCFNQYINPYLAKKTEAF